MNEKSHNVRSISFIDGHIENIYRNYDSNAQYLNLKIDALLSEISKLIKAGIKSNDILSPYPSSLSGVARCIYSLRRRRASILEDSAVADGPAWDILLDLFIHMVDNKDVSVSSASIAASCPATTALRWLNILQDQGLIVRINDPKDHRRTFVQLSPRGHKAMVEVLELYLRRDYPDQPAQSSD